MAPLPKISFDAVYEELYHIGGNLVEILLNHCMGWSLRLICEFKIDLL